jgi:hypothetical protein
VPFFLLLCAQAFSQSPSAVVYMEVVSGSIDKSSGGPADSLTVLKGTMAVSVSDTADIVRIHIKLGSSEGSGSLFTKTYEYNERGELQDGTFFIKEGNVLYFGVGNYTNISHFHAEAVIENTSGQQSSPLRFQR